MTRSPRSPLGLLLSGALFRIRRSFSLSALSILALVAFVSPSFGQGSAWPTQKISPRLYVHQTEREAAAGLLVVPQRARLVELGLNPQFLDREECALYVTRPLSAEEIAEFDDQGIHVHVEQWVPPVPGQHPNGFYLSTVEYQSLDLVQADPRVVYLETAEIQSRPTNDVGGALVGAVNARTRLARNGAGVNIGVADSGMDPTHPDFPAPVEAFDMTDGTNAATWGTNVANTVTDHGTHVVGTVIGRGTQSGGNYAGTAPAANLYFYKIGNDTNGSASAADEIEAINRALAVGCDVFTMSYGGLGGNYLDGSEATEQAIDAAVAGGMTVFISAGNNRGSGLHHSENVAPGTTNAAFVLRIQNTTGAAATGVVSLQLVWRDGVSDNNLTLACTNLGAGEALAQNFSGTSPRSTEGRGYNLTINLAANATKNFNLTLQNTAGSGTTPLVHVYLQGTPATMNGNFVVADDSFIINTPAVADNAIAVGAWVHRASWTNFQNLVFNFGETVSTLASFTSFGPRVDGTQKPDIIAPGTGTISTRDATGTLASTNSLIIDNDGLNLNGSGPAQYYVKAGTSMAAPSAAGAAALLVQENGAFTPAQIRNLLQSTASNAGSPNNQMGFGLINVYTALCTLDDDPPALTCPEDITVECTSSGGTPADDAQLTAFFAGVSATDGCDQSVTIGNDAPPVFPLGTTEVTFTATDDKTNQSQCTRKVTVVDTTPPSIDVTLSRDALWPPNHKLADLTAEVVATDLCDPNVVFALTSITSNEPEDGTGDGDTSPDIVGAATGTSDIEFQLRSERAGTGAGRVYTVIYTATDGSGNSTLDTTEVRVSHDRSGLASASAGFNAAGTAPEEGASQITIILYSGDRLTVGDPGAIADPLTYEEEGFVELARKVPDATLVDPARAAIGNVGGVARPLSSLQGDMNGDGSADLALIYSADAARRLAALDAVEFGTVGLHLPLEDGTSYLVNDIFSLGEPVPLGMGAALPVRPTPGDGRGVKPTGSEGGPSPEASIPSVTRLAAVYPNPFHASATIQLDLARPGNASVLIFGPRGALVRALTSGPREAGRYFLDWNGRDDAGRRVAPGVYFVQLQAPEAREEKKIVILQ